jgi:hypothetical protein
MHKIKKRKEADDTFHYLERPKLPHKEEITNPRNGCLQDKTL